MKRILAAKLLLFVLINSVIAQPAKTDSLTTTIVNHAFDKSLAAPYHPDLFFNAEDMNRIRSLIKAKDPVMLTGFNTLKELADQYLQESLVQYAIDDAGLRVPAIHNLADQIPVLILMYRITSEKKFADKCIAQTRAMLHFPDWGENRHFLDAGIAAFNVAFVYNGLYNEMSPGLRDSLAQATEQHIFLPAAKQIQQKAWWYTSAQNWNGVCNSGIMVAALAMRHNNPGLTRRMFTTAVQALPAYLNAFEPDGQSDEGLGYWNYGQLYTMLGVEATQRILGTSFDLYNRPGLRKTGWFPFNMSGPVKSLNIGDDAVKKNIFPSYFWYARQFNDRQLARRQYQVCMQNKTVFWMDMLYYHPALLAENEKSDTAAPAYIRGIELVSLKQNTSKNSLFVAMHGGNNAANHGHLDAGSFEIQALGEVWAYANLGRDKYVYPGYFTMDARPAYLQPDSAQQKPGRFHFYRMRAEGKNCVVFNPGNRPDQDPFGIANMLGVVTEQQADSAAVELTDCYKRDARHYIRSISLHKTKPAIYITDRITAVKPSALWWSMHTKANIKLSANKRTAFLRINDKTMIARIISPSNASFNVLEATYLPGESFPFTTNSPNSDFKKLCIHLEGVTDTAIRVGFEPANNNER